MSTYPTYKLGEIADYINGRAFKPKEWKGEGLPIVRIQNLNDKNAVYHYSDVMHEEKYLLHNGDLLFAWAASLGTYIWDNGDAWLNQHIFKVIPKENVSKKYLYYALTSIIKELYAKSHGSGMVHVTKDKFINTEIPLPPLSTQHAIVTRIETLFAELDKAVQHLRTAQQQLKTYRQAVLNHWLNNEDGKWEMVKLGEVAEMCLGKMLDKSKNKGTYQPYLRNVNVRWGSFDLDDLLEMRFEESEQERYGIQIGDLIMCEGGEPGRCAIWNATVPNMKIQKALHRIRVKDSIYNKFVYYLFSLYAQNGRLEKYFTGTTIKHLTGQSLKSIEIPLPPLAEQQRIVAEIESRLSQAEAAAASIENALQQAEALRQSILKKAFSGELV
ncbi:MAG: restriction endonuclease subunit S [Bacteroidales bacterium]|nr:restriction endonuclease subunit S [Bacteroidales bacterium]